MTGLIKEMSNIKSSTVVVAHCFRFGRFAESSHDPWSGLASMLAMLKNCPMLWYAAHRFLLQHDEMSTRL